jgi:hypothetical protein
MAGVVGQRRTVCVYCGARISGALPDSMHTVDKSVDKLRRLAAREACPAHLNVWITEWLAR